MSLGALGHFGSILGSQRLTSAFQASILADFGPYSKPKNHTGGLQVGIGACNDAELAMMCFRRGFFRTYILHQIKYPKLIQKDVFLDRLTWLKHSK